MTRTRARNSNPRCPKRRSNGNESQEQNGDRLGASLPVDLPMTYKCYDIIKSPLDGKKYLAVQFSNGLQCVLISTFSCNNDIDYCLPLEPTTCSFQEVYDFNKCFLQMYNNPALDKAPDDMSLLERISRYARGDPADLTPDTRLEDKKLWEPPRKRSCIRCPPINSEEPFAISVCVHVGCLNDPAKVSGLAHLVEHVVFLETQSYPDPWTTLSNNCIGANAATEMDHTVFHAAMNTNAEFLTVMELFSEMMISPALNPEQVENEVLNVDCENTIKLSRDFLRLGALFLLCSHSDHRMKKFGMGDKESLGRCDIAQLVRNHFKRYYRPNYMTLCIQAPLPMEDLLRLTAHHYQSLEHTEAVKPWEEISCEVDPFDMKKFSRLYKIYPFKNVQWMVISWVMSSVCWLDYQTKPLDYVAMLFSHKGKTGLDRYLKDRGWITCCATSYSSECQEQDACFVSNKYYSGIHFGMELTNEGVLRETEILKAVFSYIALLRKVGPKRRIFNELRTARANRYHYRTCMDRSVIDISISASRARSPKFILTGPDLLTTYDPESIRKVLDGLLPRQTNVMTVSRMFQNIVTTVDPTSLVTYNSQPFCPDLLDELERIGPYPEFSLPEPNPYICNNICRSVNFDIGGMTVESSLAYLRLSGKAGIQHQHTSSKRGLADYSLYTFEFTSPYCRANPHNCAMICLWKRILQERILTRIHQAILADVTFAMYDGESGLLLYLEGPSVFLPTVWLDVLDEFMNFESYLKERTFVIYKELSLKVFQNANLRYDTLSYTEDLLLYLTTYQYILMSVLENYLRYYVTFDEFLQFTRNYKSRMWICSELLGTITYSELGLLASSITRLEYDALPDGDVCLNHVLELPIGEKCLCVKAMSNSCITSTTWNYYQFGQLGEDLEDILPVLAKHISNFLFYQLRTKEQLSYYVKVEADVSFSVSSLSVIVIMQADRFKPGYVNERIDNGFVAFYDQHFDTEEKVRSLFRSANHSAQGDPLSRVQQVISDPKFLKKLRSLYVKSLPCKASKVHALPSYRKLSVQVQGNPRYEGSTPIEARFLDRQRKLYETPQTQINPDCIQRTQGKVKLEIPDDLKHENAYYITNLEKFKHSLKMYPSSSD